MNPAPTPATTTAFDQSMAMGASMAVNGSTTMTGILSDTGKSIASRRDPRGFQENGKNPLRKGMQYKFQGGDKNNHPSIPFSSQRNLTANSPAVTTNPGAIRLQPTEDARNPMGKV